MKHQQIHHLPLKKGGKNKRNVLFRCRAWRRYREIIATTTLNKKHLLNFEDAELLYNQAEKKVEKKRVIIQDENNNLYEGVDGKLIPFKK